MTARSWANDRFDGPPAVTTVDPVINKSYRFDGSPAVSIPADHFATRWTGSIRPLYSRPYTLTAVSDDTVRLWVDGRLVIGSTAPHEARTDRASVALTAGHRHTLRVEPTERTGEAHMKLLWSSSGQEQRIVPRSALYPS
ncbi:PA14 domain-containing protein [Streptomyces sp. Ac-502]|uniref:PA14 domain-containing protein n=1 Tax=Streptomyces sp. Ac-502 TaxID=3342801 RepID=UPI003862420A